MKLLIFSSCFYLFLSVQLYYILLHVSQFQSNLVVFRKVELPYSWHILKPNLVGAEGQLTSDEDVNWETLEFCPEENPCFFIEPMQGTLQPDGIHEFVLTFAPDQVGCHVICVIFDL